ncbi:hypothetical protein TH25_20940 [Thalassospira profundimaris]|uniref:Uncharacterized protein n=1 Tax=Thalassospira profundimaris TaxID=502049 RepID=A0A367WR20_9PROT|nr:hypothetical protein TH25_20940 [Thalassospira profundimaris]
MRKDDACFLRLLVNYPSHAKTALSCRILSVWQPAITNFYDKTNSGFTATRQFQAMFAFIKMLFVLHPAARTGYD